MISMIIVFIVTTLLIAAVTSTFSSLSSDEKLHALKLFGKSTLYALMSVSILSFIVFLF